MRCPICQRDLPEPKSERPWRPFCSERCKLVDLGAWIDGGYAIAGDPVEPTDESLKGQEDPRK